MSWLMALLPLLSLLVTRGCSQDVVHTNSGPVQGKLVEFGTVEAFLGIPYAEPPTGPLRLSKPVSKKRWKEVHDATSLPPPCIQAKKKNLPYIPKSYDDMSENCLFLNLWVPRHSQCTDNPKTIMLYIHGGGFRFGASNLPLYNGAKLAAHGDVIIVTINYRLGGLGFLTDLTDASPGSLGMYDQVMAIRWIKENAKYFNGDPESIVLFGESAGSWSVSFHQISPLSRSLFKRAILESGSAVDPAYNDNNADLIMLNRLYADLAGCTYNITYVNCLRQLPAEKFSEIDKEVFSKNSKYQILRVGNDFLPESTINAYLKGYFKKSEVLMGFIRDEGSTLLTEHDPDLFGAFGENVNASSFNKTTAYYSMKHFNPTGDPTQIDKIIHSYLENVNNETNYTYLKAASEFLGDYVINCGHVFQAEYQSKRCSPVYFYRFDHCPVYTQYAEWMGVAHQDEVQFVFGNPVQNFTEDEKELSRYMMDSWVTFAKTGNPQTSKWKKYSYKHPNYFDIDKRVSINLRPDNSRCDRWRKIFGTTRSYALIEV